MTDKKQPPSQEEKLVQSYVDLMNSKYGREGNKFTVESVNPLKIVDAAGNVALKTEREADIATLQYILKMWAKP